MNFSILTGAPLFRGYETEGINKILSEIPFQIKKYSAGTMISQSGQRVNSLMIVMNGRVKGEMIDFAGRVIKIEDIPAPGALAAAFIFGNRNRYPVNIIAIQDAEILIIFKEDFLKLLKSEDELLVNFLDMISNRSQFLSEKIRFLNFRTIREKLAQYILNLAGGKVKIVRLDRTQNDLADFFGVARPSIARALKELEEEGYLEATGKNIKIIDRKGLADMATD